MIRWLLGCVLGVAAAENILQVVWQIATIHSNEMSRYDYPFFSLTFMHPSVPYYYYEVLENSSKLADGARTQQAMIVHCPIHFERGHAELSDQSYGILAGVKQTGAFTHGEWGADFAPSMRPHPGDFIVKGKSGLCGFESTNLDFLLRQKGISHVILAGFLTNCCVESTMRSAYEKGYKVYTLKDCTAATSVEAHEATIQHNFGMFSIPTTSEEIMKALTEYHCHPPL